MKPHRAHAQHAQQGFALAAVLWLIAGLTIVVALVGDAAFTAKQRIAQLRERTDFLQSAISTRAQLQYRLSASRPTSAGLTDGVTLIWTNNTPYRVSTHSVVQLQDHGGLIKLNGLSRELLGSYLVNCGVPQDKTESLIDALEDYTDADHLTRINGAERETYALQGKKGPRNAPLLSVPEVWTVMGWDAHRQTLTDKACAAHFSTHHQASLMGSPINLATAPAPVLKAQGLNDQAVQDIVSARGDLQATAERAVQNNTAGGMFGAGTFSLKTLRIRHTHPTGPWVMEYTLSLDSGNPDRPWTVTQLSMGAAQNPALKLNPLVWPQEPPAVTTSDAAKLLNL
jgi:type II secretory pathway component PulK